VTVDKTKAKIDEVRKNMPKIIAEIREIPLELPWMLQPEMFIPKLNDLCPPVLNGTFGRVAATLRLRNLRIPIK
jgi:hypothetical protein